MKLTTMVPGLTAAVIPCAALATPSPKVLELPLGYDGFQACSMYGPECYGGSYEALESSTYRRLRDEEFAIRYGAGTVVRADTIAESVGLGGVTAENVTMAVAKGTIFDFCTPNIWGLSFNDTVYSGTYEYGPNLLDVLVHQGVINSRTYAFDLGTAGAFSVPTSATANSTDTASQTTKPAPSSSAATTPPASTETSPGSTSAPLTATAKPGMNSART
jgi:hypothetical protein